MPTRKTALLLTGRPGSGKTTALQRIVDRLEVPAGGFTTREVRRSGRRVGFEIVTLDGQVAWLARAGWRSPARVGRYGVDLASLDATGVPAVRLAFEAGHLVVIDEIGPMEVLSPAFCRAVAQVLDSPSVLLGTIARRSLPFSDWVKRHPAVQLIELTAQNRDGIVTEVLRRLPGLGVG